MKSHNIKTINPANGNILKEYKVMNPSEVEGIIKDANLAYLSWKQKTLNERGDCFKKAAEILRQNKRQYAELMAKEMGKPLSAGAGEIEKCAWVCEYYADYAQEYLAPQSVEMTTSKSYVTYEPLGVILAIMPWNFPFWQVFRFAAPTLMAGNGAILKHSPNTTGCALAIEKIFSEADFDQNIFRTIVIDVKDAESVIKNKGIAAVTLTGSVRAGRAVSEIAGSVLKKTVLELGGSDPYLVLEDADLDLAAQTCVASRMNNAGQTCIAAKRLIVVESKRKDFESKVLKAMQEFNLGDPFDPAVNLGPLARKDLRDHLHQQVQKSIQAGAKCLLGGQVPDMSGWYYLPTVLSEVKKGMSAFDEELFGPVAVIISAKDEDDAIRLANDTEFGLGAGVFTQDIQKGEWIASKKLEAGNCVVNTLVKSDPRLPFGGIKNSGHGRELSEFGIHEFVNIKTVLVK